MKMIHLVASGGMYGKEQVILELMREHESKGIDCTLGSIRVEGDEAKEITSVAESEGLKTQTFYLRRGLDRKGASDMATWISQNEFDLCHIHDYKASILLAFHRWRGRLPPLIRTLHGFTTTTNLSAIAVYEWLDRQSLRWHDCIVGVSHEMSEMLKTDMHVIRNGIGKIDPESFETKAVDLPSEITMFASNGITLGTIARLSDEKNQLSIIDALAKLRDQGIDANLLMIGEGPERESLERRVQELSLSDHVLMPGFYNNARQFLSLIDIFLQPSLTEGTPISILEAMDAEVPIGMSAVGGMKSLLDHGVGFRLALDGQVMATQIASFINDQSLRKDVISRARAIFDRDFSSAAMADSYLELYSKTIN